MDRTNMVSLLDIGLLTGTSTNIVMLGDGFTEITENWNPDTESKQYINMKNKANTVKGYEFSFDAEREYLSDEVQEVIDTLFKTLPTGSKCETFYYRFFKTDVKTGKADCIKVPVTVAPNTVGGAGGDTLVSSLQVNGNGDAVLGEVTITENGYSWAEKSSI